ncbi:MAG TPA: Maf family protein [candidate division Zixibacteria bacterium]|nr:Maf family protein [candidate division Zixibacteria bacterium]
MTSKSIIQLASLRPLILGSGSPRRFRLLTEAGVTFTRIVPQTEEAMKPNEAPYAYAERLAGEKALEVSRENANSAVVLGCDTIVVLNGEVLGKPENEQEAFEILSRLSGQTHVVCTAIALAVDGKLTMSGYELTEVHFNSVTSKQIREYITSGEPMDKAGAYGIQGMGAFLVDYIEGNLDNVIGLPGKLLDELAARLLSTISRD